jgi:glycosyltransferase involved in cell wall biosynthesis
VRVLALSSWWPEPADNGSRLRIAHLLHALSQEHEVHLVALAQEPGKDVQRTHMEQLCASICVVPQRTRTPSPTTVMASLWLPEPASVRRNYNPEFARIVQERTATLRPDVVIAFQIAVVPYARSVVGVPRVLEEVEVTVLWEQYAHERNPGRRLRAYLTWWKHRRYLQRLLHDFEACTVVSSLEQQLVQQIAPHGMAIAIVPNGADVTICSMAQAEAEPDTLIYPGALSFDANFDAMAYFLSTIFPHIKQARPQVRLRITGRADAAQRAALRVDGVEWTGYVPDVRPLVAHSWGEVVPLRIGGGTRLKVLEALALGTPVVSTSKGIEGLELKDGQHVLVADTPTDFAAATIRLLSQPELRMRLAAAGRRVIHEKYDWRSIGTHLNQLIAETVERRRQVV